MTGRLPEGIAEDDLHAYADGQLDPKRQAEVEAWLHAHPEWHDTVTGWQQQNDTLRAMFTAAANPDDAALIRTARKQAERHHTPDAQTGPGWRRIAAAVAIFVLGGLGGSAITARFLDNGPGLQTIAYLQTLPAAANAGYGIYASEVRHPVEVYADQKDHLVGWLGKRLGIHMQAPDLTQDGFDLVGGRLVPFAGKPGALLMYQDQTGARLTLLIGHNPDNENTGFRFSDAGKVQTFYWIDGEIGYALSGEITKPRLQNIADAVYRQIDAK
jgi:anti-sigma factor RsiW